MANASLSSRWFGFWLLCGLGFVGFPLAPALGQMETMRFELGRRLTRFEKSWESAAPPGRAASVPTMERAVRSFFGLQLDTAAQLLDRATQDAIRAAPDRAAEWLAANRCSVDFETPWTDASTGSLKFRLRRVGPAPLADDSQGAAGTTQTAHAPAGNLRLQLWNESGQIAESEWKNIVPLSRDADPETPWHTWNLGSTIPGDYRVVAMCDAGTGPCDLIAESVSISRDLHSRMEQVAAWYEDNRRAKADTPSATARWLARELKQGVRGQETEIDVPWNAWLDDFEALRDHPAQFVETLRTTTNRSFWIQLADGQRTQMVRLKIPKPSSDRFPVVVALHGAGGSENMFFEAYGAGRLIEMANERGWLVVSPRQSLSGLGMDLAAMLDAIEAMIPINRERVMVVGHSMGAAQAVAQASLYPDRIHALVALGGGGTPRSKLRSSPIRFFVGAGDRDFGRPRASALAESLRGLGCGVEYREYTNVEHMVIVQAALDDVFEFLEQGL